MITPQQCLAGLFFLATLVGFLGLFFAMLVDAASG
jgi:hypothetical protein